MKKTLAIVLALVMVLAMIPAMSAHTTEYKTITDKSYYLTINEVGAAGHVQTYPAVANSITYEYDWNAVEADETGRYTEPVAMAEVTVEGWDTEFTGSADKVTVDGKVLTAGMVGGAVTFPVELTKAGYTDTFVITATKTVGDKLITETAKVSIVLKNIGSEPKATKTAVITNIVSKTDDMSAYIVGSKIYFDFINKEGLATALITFADENGKAFTGRVYAQNPVVKQADGTYVADPTLVSTVGGAEVKLDASAAKFDFATALEGETFKFFLDAANANYFTKAYGVEFRSDIKPEDPKGIYFAETTKTIAMGETYAPVVMGVKTGKAVAATIKIGDKTDKEVIDIVDNAVIGTREGVAYITAEYTVPGSKNTYVSSSMKIVVTLPGESIPEVDPSAEIYYVTCRALNVRAGAGTSYKKVDLIHRGDAVKVVELKNGWAKLDDGTYVCAKYIAK